MKPLTQADKDAAKRMTDTINLHRVANEWEDIKTKYVAFKMSDGTSDDVLYDTYQDAYSHQSLPQTCIYISFMNLMGGAKLEEMYHVLQFNREAYDRGARMADPDKHRELIMTSGQYDWRNRRIRAMRPHV